MPDSPRISVVIPAWNAAEALPETLASVVAQDCAGLEVLVVDDGSDDETAALAERYGPPVRCLRRSNHGGPSAPRNQGLRAAANPLVAIFDADDVMLPGKLQAQAEVLAAYPVVDLVFTDFEVVDGSGRIRRNRFLDDYRSFRKRLEPTADPAVSLIGGSDLFHELLRANFVGTSSVVARREVLLDAGGFDETLKNADDRDMWFRLARGGAVFAYLDRVGHRYRQLPGGVSHRGSGRLPAVIEVLERQAAHIAEPALLHVHRRALARAVLGLAWYRRREGDLDSAWRLYKRAVGLHPSLASLRGMAWTGLRRTFSGS